MTQEQNQLIFELTRRKLEAELATEEEESKLQRELIAKKSEACVAAAVTVAEASVTGRAQPQKWSTTEEDDTTGEVPPKVMSIILRYSGLTYEEIV